MKLLVISMVSIMFAFASCKETSEENPQQADCVPVVPEIERPLHAKVLVVPANNKEYDYFKELMMRYSYDAESKEYGIRYSGRERSRLVVTLLKPGKTVTAKYGIVQLKGHTSDMRSCFARASQCIVPGKTILVAGGCESSYDACNYANMNISAFTVNHIGQGPVNDYLVLQMQSLLQDYSYQETLNRLRVSAPLVMAQYTYPKTD